MHFELLTRRKWFYKRFEIYLRLYCLNTEVKHVDKRKSFFWKRVAQNYKSLTKGKVCMGKSGLDFISSRILSQGDSHNLYFTWPWPISSLCSLRLDERFCQTMAYWLRLQTKTPLIGGKAGINAKTKIPGHILRNWPRVEMNARLVQISATTCPLS